ncbi:MAG: DNA alkylation repair protein [Peptostreptococcaceae bacterium]|nr:DNA alkylation repair protein [Peptostreptococcaceae bacterium]
MVRNNLSVTEQVIEDLLELTDEKYRIFEAKLIPNIDLETILGIRTPKLRAYAKVFSNTNAKFEFLDDLPHSYHEENLLHIYLLENISKNPDEILKHLNDFIPYISNWATCDSFKAISIKKYPDKVLSWTKNWIKADCVYSVRFGIVTSLKVLLGDDFSEEMFDEIANIKSDEYYINIAIAWYLCEAIIKNHDYAIKVIENGNLDKWVNNKTIQKCTESYRITDEQKDYLRGYRK